MFIIQARRDEFRWISGIFAERDAADEYLALIPDEARPRHTVTRAEGLSYPFYIVEDEGGFHFLSEAGVREALTHYLAPAKNGGDVCATIYRIAGDWRPPRAGWDYMGALPHHHVTDATLDLIKREGVAAIWARGS